MIEHQPFGSTGHRSSKVIFGAAALGGMSQARADATLETMLAYGLNHVDTAASYGASEDRLAPFLQDHRGDVFLATKTGERDGSGARRSLETSLERMGVDHVDMIQLHNLVEEDEWREAFSPGGAVPALFAARDAGLCRHVGITGHGLRIARMHLRSLGEAPFASVLFAYNHSLLSEFPDYAADVELLRNVCAEQGVAAQTIKSIARRRWSDPDQPHFSWYEPIDDAGARARATEYVLAEPDLFLNTSSDARLFEEILRVAAGERQEPSADQLAQDRVEAGITPIFDGADLEVIR